MQINRQIVVFDAADITAESAFWAALLGGTVDAEDDWHMISVDGGPQLGIQLAPNHVQPDKPADDIDATDGFQVYADPAGHPFCLCW